MSLKIEKLNNLEAIAKYMTKAVKQDNHPPCFWDLKDLIHHFETDNNFDYKVRVPIWESMDGYKMRKTYNNILKMLTAIVEANNSQMKDKPKTLRQINEALYGVLCDMLATRKGHDENGQIDFNQNDLDSMENTYAYIKVCYLLEDPDGDREQEIFDDKEEYPLLNDEEAYSELACRLNNTRIY